MLPDPVQLSPAERVTASEGMLGDLEGLGCSSELSIINTIIIFVCFVFSSSSFFVVVDCFQQVGIIKIFKKRLGLIHPLDFLLPPRKYCGLGGGIGVLVWCGVP